MKYLPIALLMLTGLAYGEDKECSKLENSLQRLDCFDKLFPRTGGQSTPSEKIESEIITEIKVVPKKLNTGALGSPGSPQGADHAVTSSTPADPAPREKPASSGNRGRFGGLFDKKDPVVITATVRAIRNREKQKMVFLLDNEQIWLQNTPRSLPIREGDKVTIKSGTVGGFVMRTSSGTSTRVRRIK